MKETDDTPLQGATRSLCLSVFILSTIIPSMLPSMLPFQPLCFGDFGIN